MSSRRSVVLKVAGLTMFALLVVAACGSSGSSTTEKVDPRALFHGAGVDIRPAPSGEVGAPKRGGKVTFALRAEDANGYCLPEAQLDASGEQVAGSVYDTLTRPNDDGEFVPYLAKDVTHSADYQTWTIELRPDISFSDGSPLTAEVVKDNLNAYRGSYPGRKALLYRFVYDDIADVTVTDPLTVKVSMKKPWKDFDAYLYGSRRIGIMGLAQLNDAENCGSHLVGTGPFKLVSWQVNERYVLKPNPHYWRKGADGKPLPYLSELDYVPIPDSQAQVNSLNAKTVDAVLTPVSSAVVALRKLAKQGKARVITSVRGTEVRFYMMNAKKPPFDDYTMRLAAIEAVDMGQINRDLNHNITPLASQPFAPGNPVYTKGLPRIEPNMAHAKKLVAAYTKAHGASPKVVVLTDSDPISGQKARVIAGYLSKAGFDASVGTVSQAQLVSSTIGGTFQMHFGRNYGGTDPGAQYVWWHSGYPTNFAGIKDPVIDCLLDVGRSGGAAGDCLKDPELNAEFDKDLPAGAKPLREIDPDTDTKAIYEDISVEFNKKAWYLWGSYAPWTVATAPDVHGVFGADNPDGSKPSRGLSNGTAVEALWVE